MNSPRYAPAGLLVEHGEDRIMIDGGRGSEPSGKLQAWLVTDERAELIREIREIARARSVEPKVDSYSSSGGLTVRPRRVVHTSHPTYGYLIELSGRRVVWAPEFLKFPAWATGAELMFAEAAGWERPIRFAGGVGGHASVVEIARSALKRGVQRLVFAHIGRPSIRAIDSGLQPDFGEVGQQGAVYLLRSADTP